MKRLLASLCALALVFAFAPTPALAADWSIGVAPDRGEVIELSTLDIINMGGNVGDDAWDFGGNILALHDSGPYTLTGDYGSYLEVVVYSSDPVQITLDNATLNDIECNDQTIRFWLVEDNTVRGYIMTTGSSNADLTFDGNSGSTLSIDGNAGILLSKSGSSIEIYGGAIHIPIFVPRSTPSTQLP